MDTLVGVLEATIQEGERARIDSIPYRALLGAESASPPEAGAVWGHLLEVGALADPAAAEWAETLGVILSEGPLARRILTSLGGSVAEDDTVDRTRLTDVYRRLADCVQAGEIFRAGDC
jgi:hypothetical protein